MRPPAQARAARRGPRGPRRGCGPTLPEAARWLALLLGLGGALGLGCSDKKKLRGSRPRPGAVTVLSRGREPRQPLRYRYRAGETLRYRLTSSRRLTGMPGPASPVKAVLSVHTARVNGRRARLRWQVEQVQGVPRQRAPLWVETSDRGEISAVAERDRPPEPGRPSSASGKPVGQTVHQLYLAWPEAPVGPGARWEQRRDLILAASVQGGIRAKVRARYSFDRIARCGQSRCAHLSVRTRIEVRHRAGVVKVEGKGEGSGSVVFDLQQGRLLESRTRADVTLTASLRPRKVKQRLHLEQSMTLTR